MEKRELGNTGIYVTPAGMGVLTVGRSQLNLPIKEGAEVIKHALDLGINFLDTAEYYQTYAYIREALKETNERPVICSKSLKATYDGMEAAINDALKELDIDYLDIMLLHEVRSKQDFDHRRGAWQCLLDYRKKGKIKAIGLSTHHVDVTELASYISDCDVVFSLINFMGLGIRKGEASGTKEEMAKAIKMCSEKGKGVFAMKVFGGGNLSADYVKALDYVTGLYGVDSVMVGIGKKPEAETIVSYMEGRLPSDYKPDVSKKKIRIELGNCEGCGACKKRCPNGAIDWGEYGFAKIDYDKCLNCGYCAYVCPVRAIIMW